MKYTIIALFIACLFSLSLTPVYADDEINILVLHSYTLDYDWTNTIHTGIENTLHASFPEAQIIVEEMDTKRIYTEEYMDSLLKKYKEKYESVQFDLIISSDDNALTFVLENRDELFPDVPYIFCGANYFKPARIEGYKNITGVNEEAGFEEGINIALSFHPDIEHIIIINDTTTTGTIINNEIKNYLPRLKSKYTVEVLDNFTVPQIVDTLKLYDASNSLIYYTLFFRDSEGVNYVVGDVLSILSKETDIPIYGTWDFSLGYGIVGGYLTTGGQQGRQAGELGIRVLNGEDINTIPVIMDTPKEFMFDWEQLIAHNIDLGIVPERSKIINKPPTYFQENVILLRGLISLFCFLLAVLLAKLFIFKRK